MRLVCLCIVCLLAGAASAEEEVPPLERTVRLSLWGVGLNDAAREIYAQTGVEVRYYLPDLPADENTDNLFLVSGRVPVGTIMEALARRYGFRYRVTATGHIECSRSYGWIGSEPSLVFPRLSPPTDGGLESVRKFLGELVKPLAVLPGEYSLTVEEYPLPDRPDSLRITAVLPPVLGEYLDRAARCLDGDAGDYRFVSGQAIPPGLFARAGVLPPDWRSLPGKPLVRPRGGGAREILADTAEQAGVAILLPALPSTEGRELPFDVERYTLGGLTGALAKLWGLGGRTFLAGGAVLFGRSEGGYEMDRRSRQLFWDGLAVAGFAVLSPGRGEDVAAALRREVFPGVWRDPVCAMQYSPRAGRLVVIAPLNVVAAVGAYLAELDGR
jgi:hypothetical protein